MGLMYHFCYAVKAGDCSNEQGKNLMFRVVFYRNENGVEFVRDWLKYELPVADRQIIGENLATLQEGFSMIGMPLIKPMGDGIFELRSRITDKRIARILFFHATDGLILLHGFIKKTESTSDLILSFKISRIISQSSSTSCLLIDSGHSPI